MPKRKASSAHADAPDAPGHADKKPEAANGPPDAAKPASDSMAMPSNQPRVVVGEGSYAGLVDKARWLSEGEIRDALASMKGEECLGDSACLMLLILLVSDVRHRQLALETLSRLGALAVLHEQKKDSELAALLLAEMAAESADQIRDEARNRFFATCGALQQTCFELGLKDWAMGAPSQAAKAVCGNLSSLPAAQLERIAADLFSAKSLPPPLHLSNAIKYSLRLASPCIEPVLSNPTLVFESRLSSLNRTLGGAYASPSVDRLLARQFALATHLKYKMDSDALINPEWTQLPQFDRGILRVPKTWAAVTSALHGIVFSHELGATLCEIESFGNGLLTVRTPGVALAKRIEAVALLDKPGDQAVLTQLRCLRALANKDMSKCVTASVATRLHLDKVDTDESIDFGFAFASPEHVSECFPQVKVDGTGSRYKVRFERGAATRAAAIGDRTLPIRKLSPWQMGAVRHCLGRTPVVGVRGPLGSGKKLVAAQVIASLLAKGERVGVLCPTRSHLVALFDELKTRPDVDSAQMCAMFDGDGEFGPEAIVKRAKEEIVRVLETVRKLAGVLSVPDVDAASASCEAAQWFLSQAKMNAAWKSPEVAELVGGEDGFNAMVKKVQHLNRFQMLAAEPAQRFVGACVARIVGCTPQTWSRLDENLSVDVAVVFGGVDQTLVLMAGTMGFPKRVVFIGDAMDSPLLRALPDESVVNLEPRSREVAPVAGFPSRPQLIASAAVTGIKDPLVCASEHAVALYMFARVLGHKDVVILADSRSQLLALHLVLKARCASLPAFGLPRDLALAGDCVYPASIVICCACTPSSSSNSDPSAVPTDLASQLASSVCTSALLLLIVPPNFAPTSSCAIQGSPSKPSVMLGEFAGDDLSQNRGDEFVVAGGPTELGVIVSHLLFSSA